jgi:hypothetical protein
MPYLRFFQRIPIIPGLLYINFSKSGISLSVGKHGWTVTMGKHGIRFIVGLSGTGLFVTEHINYKKFKDKKEKQIDIDIQAFIGGRNGKKEER